MNRQELERQYAAAMTGAGVTPLERWSTVRVTGRDRAAFLHNMCSNDVKGLKPGEVCEAFFTDVKGKIVGYALVLAGAEAIALVGVPEQAGRLVAHLDRYIIREDVQLADENAGMAWTIVLGEKAKDVDAGLQPPNWLVPYAAAGPGAYLVGCRAEDAASVRSAMLEKGGMDCSPELLQSIRIEAGWPLFGVDFDGTNLPQEVGRDAEAINFRKGCYLGQETIARIDALGHVNKKLVQVRFAGDEVPPAGAELTQGEQGVGRITSSTWSPHWQVPLALAMVRRGANELGSRLECGSIAGTVVAREKNDRN